MSLKEMIDLPILPLLTELGLKPTEMMVLALLWQNVKNTRSLLDKLVSKVSVLERAIEQVSKSDVNLKKE